MISNKNKVKLQNPLVWAPLLFFMFYFLELWWLDYDYFQVLAGDDIRCFPKALQGLEHYSNLLTSFSRFRPATALLIWISAFLSNGQYSTLIMIGAGLHAFNALLFFALLWKVMRASPGIAMGLTIVATFNRFTAYLIAPELAIMEGAAITTYLVFLWALFRLIDSTKIMWAFFTSLSFFIILHIHERYMVLIGACLMVAVPTYSANRRAGIVIAVCSIAGLAFNFSAKKLFIHAPILMGTTTKAIELNPEAILAFWTDGLLNLLGVNRGPSYLSVLSYSDSPKWIKLLGILSMITVISILYRSFIYAYRSMKSTRFDSKLGWKLALLIGLISALLLSASITIRQEYRWLYPAYLSFLILVGAGTRISREAYKIPATQILLASFILIAVTSELAIREFQDNFYARNAYRLANNLYTLIQKSPELKASKEIIIGGDELSISNWVFMGDAFANFYKLPPLVFISSPSGNALRPMAAPSVMYQQSSGKFMLSASAVENQANSLSTAVTINPPVMQISTPNGKPSFAFTLKETDGWMLTSPVELMVQVPRAGKNLKVTFSHALTGGDGVDLAIIAQFAGQESRELLSVHVPALKNVARSEWHFHQLELPENCQSLRISIESKSGDQASDWLFFQAFRFR
jgi:hypothetical protein